MKRLLVFTLAVLFTTALLLISMTLHAHQTSPDPNTPHGYVTSVSRSGWGTHNPNAGGDVWVHDFVWHGQEAIAVHYIYFVNYEDHKLNYTYRFDFAVHWLWKNTGTVRETFYATDPRVDKVDGSLAPNGLLETSSHSSYDAAPHKLWEGEKLKAEAQTIITFWEPGTNNAFDELSVPDDIKLTIQ